MTERNGEKFIPQCPRNNLSCDQNNEMEDSRNVCSSIDSGRSSISSNHNSNCDEISNKELEANAKRLADGMNTSCPASLHSDRKCATVDDIELYADVTLIPRSTEIVPTAVKSEIHCAKNSLYKGKACKPTRVTKSVANTQIQMHDQTKKVTSSDNKFLGKTGEGKCQSSTRRKTRVNSSKNSFKRILNSPSTAEKRDEMGSRQSSIAHQNSIRIFSEQTGADGSPSNLNIHQKISEPAQQCNFTDSSSADRSNRINQREPSSAYSDTSVRIENTFKESNHQLIDQSISVSPDDNAIVDSNDNKSACKLSISKSTYPVIKSADENYSCASFVRLSPIRSKLNPSSCSHQTQTCRNVPKSRGSGFLSVRPFNSAHNSPLHSCSSHKTTLLSKSLTGSDPLLTPMYTPVNSCSQKLQSQRISVNHTTKNVIREANYCTETHWTREQMREDKSVSTPSIVIENISTDVHCKHQPKSSHVNEEDNVVACPDEVKSTASAPIGFPKLNRKTGYVCSKCDSSDQNTDVYEKGKTDHRLNSSTDENITEISSTLASKKECDLANHFVEMTSDCNHVCLCNSVEKEENHSATDCPDMLQLHVNVDAIQPTCGPSLSDYSTLYNHGQNSAAVGLGDYLYFCNMDGHFFAVPNSQTFYSFQPSLTTIIPDSAYSSPGPVPSEIKNAPFFENYAPLLNNSVSFPVLQPSGKEKFNRLFIPYGLTGQSHIPCSDQNLVWPEVVFPENRNQMIFRLGGSHMPTPNPDKLNHGFGMFRLPTGQSNSITQLTTPTNQKRMSRTNERQVINSERRCNNSTQRGILFGQSESTGLLGLTKEPSGLLGNAKPGLLAEPVRISSSLGDKRLSFYKDESGRTSKHKKHSSKTNLYIRGLPSTFTEEQLHTLAPDKELIRSVKLIKGTEGELYGFIDFTSNVAAKDALLHIKSTNRELYVNFAYESEKDPQNVYITNIPETWTAENVDDLKKIFQSYGQISTAIVMTKRSNNFCTGAGFVRFVRPEDAQSAIEGIRKSRVVLDEFKGPLDVKLADRQKQNEDEILNACACRNYRPLMKPVLPLCITAKPERITEKPTLRPSFTTTAKPAPRATSIFNPQPMDQGLLVRTPTNLGLLTTPQASFGSIEMMQRLPFLERSPQRSALPDIQSVQIFNPNPYVQNAIGGFGFHIPVVLNSSNNYMNSSALPLCNFHGPFESPHSNPGDLNRVTYNSVHPFLNMGMLDRPNNILPALKLPEDSMVSIKSNEGINALTQASNISYPNFLISAQNQINGWFGPNIFQRTFPSA